MNNANHADVKRFGRQSKRSAILSLSLSLVSLAMSVHDKAGILLLGLTHGHRDVRRRARHEGHQILPKFFDPFVPPGGGYVNRLSPDEYAVKLGELHLLGSMPEPVAEEPQVTPKKRASRVAKPKEPKVEAEKPRAPRKPKTTGEAPV